MSMISRNNAIKKPSRHQKKIKAWLIYASAALCLGAGAYILILVLTPQVMMTPSTTDWNTPVKHSDEKLTENRLYIPKLKLNITYKDGGAEVLSSNAWHRYPERGDPGQGGNFILAAHRFELGLTPGEVRRKSPFYHLNLLEPGDKIYVDYEGKRYEYITTKRYSVKPTAIEIENPSIDPVMTLYTCTFKGQADGREVITATRTSIDVDPTKEL